MPKVSTHLMFQGEAQEAIALYEKAFKDFEALERQLFGEGEGGRPGSLKLVRAELHGHSLVIFNSPIAHNFGFTPATSVLIDFECENELRDAFEVLSDEGKILMPLDKYEFSPLFGWTTDRFGMSWQLNLTEHRASNGSET